MAWVATAPSPARPHGTAEPTARNFEATAIPHDAEEESNPTIEKVIAPPAREDLSAPGPTQSSGAGSLDARPPAQCQAASRWVSVARHHLAHHPGVDAAAGKEDRGAQRLAGREHSDHADAKVDGPGHLLVGHPAELLHHPEDGRRPPRGPVDPGGRAVGQAAGQVAGQPAAGDVAK